MFGISVILVFHGVIPLTRVLLSLARVSPQAGSTVIWERLGASLFSALNYANDWQIIIHITSLHISCKAGLIRWVFSLAEAQCLMTDSNTLMGKEQGVSLSASAQSIKYKIAHPGLFPIPYRKGGAPGALEGLHILAGLIQLI